MEKTLTAEECKSKLFEMGIKFGVSPALISARLLSKEDKQDMLNGRITVEALAAHVKAWKACGMPDLSKGFIKP